MELKEFNVFGGELFTPTVNLFNDLPYDVTDPLLVDGLEGLLPNVNFKTDRSIITVCEAFGKDLIIDRKWCDRLKRFMFQFTTRKIGITDYGEFFGSPYIGLQKITFLSADRNEWFSDIWDVDEEELKENLHACEWVNKDWAVTGDVFNLTIPYLMYKVFHSKLIDAKLKQEALVNIIFMYHCKCLTSILHNDYPHLARPEVAYETYNQLSLKFDLKKYGSWRVLLLARAEFIINPRTGIHYNTFTKMDNDKKIIYMVGDIQDRLRGVINDINKVFHDVKKRTNLVKIDSATVNLEEGLTIKEISKEVNQYRGYIINVLNSGTGFYKPTILPLIAEKVDGAPVDKLERIVKEFPGNFKSKSLKGQVYRDFIDDILTHLFEYLSLNSIKINNFKEVINRMQGTYGSPRNQHELVLKIRSIGDDIVQDITGIRTRVTYSSLRTALILYIILRTLIKDKV